MATSYRLAAVLLHGVEDYSSWQVQCADVLNDPNLDDHIAEGAQAPKPDTDGKWAINDRRALTQIRLRVAPHIIVDVKNAKTALEAWTTLKDNYQTEGGIGVILAVRQLFSIRARDDDDIQGHLRIMKENAEELRTFGYPLADPVFSLALLTSMPDTWDSWVSSAALDSELLKKPSKVHAAILMEHRRRNPPKNYADSANSELA